MYHTVTMVNEYYNMYTYIRPTVLLTVYDVLYVVQCTTYIAYTVRMYDVHCTSYMLRYRQNHVHVLFTTANIIQETNIDKYITWYLHTHVTCSYYHF